MSVSIKIVNLAATADLKQQVNLSKLKKHVGFVYSGRFYGGRCAYLKDQHTVGRVSIFASGKMISVGTRSLKSAQSDLEYAAKRVFAIQAAQLTKITVTIHNIVATADLGCEINLERLSQNVPHIIYDPEQFAAAIYYAEQLDGASILIFQSGKVGLAGLRRFSQLREARKVLQGLTVWKSS